MPNDSPSDMSRRPPQILRNEVVRVLRATGDEMNQFTDEPIPEEKMVGLVCTVQGATPNDDGTGWLLILQADDDDIWLSTAIPEHDLEPLGEMIVDIDDRDNRVPLDRSAGMQWCDEVCVSVDFTAATSAEASALDGKFVEWIKRVVPGNNILGRLHLFHDDSWWMSFFIDQPGNDMLDVFDTLMHDAIATAGWRNEDDDVTLVSRWERQTAPGGEFVIDHDVEMVEIRYNRYEGTDRRVRRVAPWPDRTA